MAKKKDMRFAGRLKKLRVQAGLTQAKLAEMAGLHAFGVAKLEQGERKPLWETVQALADALGVAVDDFRDRPAKKRRG